MAFARLRVAKPYKTAADRRRELRDSLWPGMGRRIWDRRKEDGYTTIPRTLPLIMTLINLLVKNVDAARVYLELWSRVSDEGFIEMVDEEEHAFAAGYITKRNQRTFDERMQVLVDLGFIEVKPKGRWKYGYALLLHPHDVVESLKETHEVPDEWWTLYLHRLQQIGAERGTPKKKAKTAEQGKGA